MVVADSARASTAAGGDSVRTDEAIHDFHNFCGSTSFGRSTGRVGEYRGESAGSDDSGDGHRPGRRWSVSFKLRPRRGTASQWSSANPVLDIAEIGLEMGSENRLKFGTGSGAWNSLPYLEGWTQGKFDAAFAAKNTDALSEGATNLYFSQAAFDSAFAGKTTDDLPAGSSNLYFTDALFDGRFGADFPAAFDTRLAAKRTSDLAEGANLYYTAARFDSAFAAKTTANLTEGANLYYTDARARAAFSATAPVALSAGVISMPASTNSVDGYLTSADHTTFAAKESALTFSSPLSRAVNTISIPVASASVNGYLSSSDFTAFTNKLNLSGGTLTGN